MVLHVFELWWREGGTPSARAVALCSTTKAKAEASVEVKKSPVLWDGVVLHLQQERANGEDTRERGRGWCSKVRARQKKFLRCAS